VALSPGEQPSSPLTATGAAPARGKRAPRPRHSRILCARSAKRALDDSRFAREARSGLGGGGAKV
jgi:hypothetical protein